MITVVAAAIERDGLILIGQRKSTAHHPLKWEFPGGKVDPGETPETALIRELAEELSIEASIAGEIARYEYRYPGKEAILLVFYRVTEFRGEPVNRAFEKIAWVSPEKLSEYDFLEGDVDFVDLLQSRSS